MEKIQEVSPAESSSTDTSLEHVQNNDKKNVFANERQHSEKHAQMAEERVPHPTMLVQTLSLRLSSEIKVEANNSQVNVNKEGSRRPHYRFQYLNVMNARTKKPNVVPIGDSKPKRKANKSVATTHKKTVASDTTIQKPKSTCKSLPRSSMFKRRLIAADQASVFMEMTSVHISSCLVLSQLLSDHNRSELEIHDHSNEPSSSKLVPKVVPLAFKTATSRQELELLFHHHIAMLRTTEHPSDTISIHNEDGNPA
ncbi:hypothetical protein Tco_0483433 [Tanacetum coccineum]